MIRRIARRLALPAALTAGLSLAAGPALAVKGGNGHPNSTDSPCTVLPGNVVQVVGLPTDQVINFMVTDAGGTDGWVLGFTPGGTWTVSVPAPTGPTTYQFVSRTFGKDGSRYTVFASCSA